MGFPRNFPQWKKFLKMTVAKNRIVHGAPYYLYIMGTFGKRLPHIFEPDGAELFEESLKILKKYDREIKSIFKPHALTDLPRLEYMIKKSGIRNYEVDQGHVMVLTAGAKFVISNAYSTAMFDAFYLRKPVIQYSDSDPTLLKLFGNGSIAGRCCDFFINRDVKKLEDTLNKLIYNKIELDRDTEFMKETFREINLSFYKFLDKLFLVRDML